MECSCLTRDFFRSDTDRMNRRPGRGRGPISDPFAVLGPHGHSGDRQRDPRVPPRRARRQRDSRDDGRELCALHEVTVPGLFAGRCGVTSPYFCASHGLRRQEKEDPYALGSCLGCRSLPFLGRIPLRMAEQIGAAHGAGGCRWRSFAVWHQTPAASPSWAISTAGMDGVIRCGCRQMQASGTVLPRLTPARDTSFESGSATAASCRQGDHWHARRRDPCDGVDRRQRLRVSSGVTMRGGGPRHGAGGRQTLAIYEMHAGSWTRPTTIRRNARLGRAWRRLIPISSSRSSRMSIHADHGTPFTGRGAISRFPNLRQAPVTLGEVVRLPGQRLPPRRPGGDPRLGAGTFRRMRMAWPALTVRHSI